METCKKRYYVWKQANRLNKWWERYVLIFGSFIVPSGYCFILLNLFLHLTLIFLLGKTYSVPISTCQHVCMCTFWFDNFMPTRTGSHSIRSNQLQQNKCHETDKRPCFKCIFSRKLIFFCWLHWIPDKKSLCLHSKQIFTHLNAWRHNINRWVGFNSCFSVKFYWNSERYLRAECKSVRERKIKYQFHYWLLTLNVYIKKYMKYIVTLSAISFCLLLTGA